MPTTQFTSFWIIHSNQFQCNCSFRGAKTVKPIDRKEKKKNDFLQFSNFQSRNVAALWPCGRPCRKAVDTLNGNSHFGLVRRYRCTVVSRMCCVRREFERGNSENSAVASSGNQCACPPKRWLVVGKLSSATCTTSTALFCLHIIQSASSTSIWYAHGVWILFLNSSQFFIFGFPRVYFYATCGARSRSLPDFIIKNNFPLRLLFSLFFVWHSRFRVSCFGRNLYHHHADISTRTNALCGMCANGRLHMLHSIFVCPIEMRSRLLSFTLSQRENGCATITFNAQNLKLHARESFAKLFAIISFHFRLVRWFHRTLIPHWPHWFWLTFAHARNGCERSRH